MATLHAVAQVGGPGTPSPLIRHDRSDTATIYVRLPEVVVSATRSRIPIDESPSAVTVVTREELDRSAGQRLASVLQGLPGLMVRDLGGLHSIKTLSTRGTGSVHTLFLLNGLRLNSPQNGLVDLGLLTGEAFEQVEVVRGGQSGLYGADAVGGLVHLVPRRASDSLRVGLAIETGSFGLRAGRASTSFSLAGVSVAAGIGYEESDGAYRFVGSVGGQEQILRRTGADSRFATGFAHILAPISKSTSISLFTNVSSADRGSPGPYTGSADRSARLGDQGIQTIAQIVSSLASLGTVSASVGLQQSTQHYTDLTFPPGVDERTRVSSLAFSAQWNVPLSSSLLGVVVADAGRERIDARQIPEAPDRRQWGLTAGLEMFSRAFEPLVPRVSLYPSARYDWISGVGGRVSPRLGLNLWLTRTGSVTLRASAGTSYRVANYNELYWIDGGNPELHPESAISADAGVILTFEAAGRQRIDLGAFRISMQDRITGWPPVNLSASTLTGAELLWKWDFSPWGLYSTISATHTRAINDSDPHRGNQLPYVPLWEGRAALGERVGAARGEIAVLMMSRRYTTFDNAQALSSDPFAVVSLWIEYAFALMQSRATVRMDIDNVFNADYEIVAAYPMPLRSMRLGLRFDL